jgi:REP element-mobilizing transposase RayT
MSHTESLQPGCFYHLYNRGNNRENLFLEEKNYLYFLQLFSRRLTDSVGLFTFCLLPNHFHLLIRTMEEKDSELSRKLSNFFNAYAKAVNKTYGRTGSLFQKPFGRRRIDSDADLLNLVFYIHFNPQKHSLVEDFRKWKWSSFRAIEKNSSTFLRCGEVLAWYGGKAGFCEFHQGMADESRIRGCIMED